MKIYQASLGFKKLVAMSATVSMGGLMIGSILILWYEYITKPEQMFFILILYLLLAFSAYIYAKLASKESR